jgi:hypothetical protein
MPKSQRMSSDDWLPNYVRNHVLDTLTPAERMQFRIVCGRGAAEVSDWADATLPKYPVIWRRLKSAQRQRRFRSVPNMEKWMNDWRAAERTLGKELTEILRRNRANLNQSSKATPADTLHAALTLLDAQLNTDSSPVRITAPNVDA